MWVEIIICVTCYALGVATAKNLKRFWLKLRSDPLTTVNNEIRELHEVADRLIAKGGGRS